MAIVDGKIELTDCDLIQIGQSSIKPLGKQWICLRWPGRNKWLEAPFLILPNTFFEDDNMPWDMAFSKCRTTKTFVHRKGSVLQLAVGPTARSFVVPASAGDSCPACSR